MAAIGGGQAVLGHAAKNQAASAKNKNRAELYRQQQAKLVEDHYVKAISDSRSAASLERSGRSAGRVSQARDALLGRASAAREAQLDTARDAATIAFREVTRQREAADARAYAAIGGAPERGKEPPKPVWDRGPGILGLAAGVIQGAASGYLQDDQLKTNEVLRNR